MRTYHFALIMSCALLLFAGCSRAPQADQAAAPLPSSLVAEAGGKAAFIEFYSPT
jgi:hypothetical protein